MTTLDWLIVAFTVLLASFGWRQGFVAGALALVGFAAGAFAGSRLGPLLLAEGSASPYAPLVALVGGVLGGSLLAGVLEGAGFVLRSRLRWSPVAAVDGALGAVLSAAVALGLVWLAGAVALHTPGVRELRRDIQRSEILSRLNGALPPSGPLLNALARFDPFPRIDGPEADVAPPRAAIARDPDVAAAAAGVVRVLGTACGLGVAGSGWIAAPEMVVTNAHVVAGQDDTTVELEGREPRLDARPVAFDPVNDVAVLHVPGLGGRELPLADEPRAGTAAAALGFPQNGPYTVRAARLGQTRAVVSQDAYGRGPVTRSIASFRGVVRPGNSGGPLVDAGGRVVATVFAASRGTARRGGYAVPNDLVTRAIRRADRAEVDTGPCAS